MSLPPPVLPLRSLPGTTVVADTMSVQGTGQVKEAQRPE